MTNQTELRDRASVRPEGSGKRLRRRLKRSVKGLVVGVLRPAVPVAPDRLDHVRRILIVRPNFRIGNIVIATGVIAALRQRFPEARLEFLGTDTTAAVLAGQPIDQLHVVSRRFIWRPWEYVALLARLRRRGFDLVVQPNAGSLGGHFMAAVVGRRYRMGRSRDTRRLYEIEVDGPRAHAYDNAAHFARTLGVRIADRPALVVTDAERRAAARQLAEQRPNGQAPDAFDAVFVGGRGRKRWPEAAWHGLIHAFERRGRPFVVFLGPEEAPMRDGLRAALDGSVWGTLVEPRPLREFMAMVSLARCLITPDSGPMHIAAGLRVPTVVIVLARVSLEFVPRGRWDAALLNPTAEEITETVDELVSPPPASAP